jgi:hypothetical protein
VRQLRPLAGRGRWGNAGGRCRSSETRQMPEARPNPNVYNW